MQSRVQTLGAIVGRGRAKGECMPAKLTRDQRTDRLIAKTRLRVEQTSPDARLLRHMPSSTLGVLIRECGYARTSAKLLSDLCDRLREVGVEFSPRTD